MSAPGLYRGRPALELDLIREPGPGERGTFGVLYVRDDAAPRKLCDTLEDPWHSEKLAGDTRIPEGRYELRLRTVGGFHERYLRRYGPDFHKGMLWLQDVPQFELILMHGGNTIKDTKGCVLVGVRSSGGLIQSQIMYRRTYPLPAAHLAAGGVAHITVASSR